ncbi:MAG: G5 domain-containing protein [Firmicutes bacterium]|nr:G5 domain-containing protein [Bacillota bacterium]
MLKRAAIFFIIVFSMAFFSVTASAYQSPATKYVYVDDNGTVTRHATNADTVDRVLKYINAELGEGDIVNPPLETKLETGMIITVERCKAVTIVLDDVPRKVYSVKKTVGELLEENKDILCQEFVIKDIEADAFVTDGMVINLTSSEVIKYTKTEKTPYQITYIDDASLYAGIELVEVAGVEGQTEVVYKDVYVNDELVATEEVSRVAVSHPEGAVVRRGTQDVVDGIKFKKAMQMVVTGYTPWDEGCTGITASGKVADFGMIAADTRVLPFGTKIYVPGYGIGVVEDRGGAIKGNRLDLCYMSLTEAFKWGVRDMIVYILE